MYQLTLAAAALVACLVSAAPLKAQVSRDDKAFRIEAVEGDPHLWAMLIGVSDYQKARPLPGTINDVNQIAKSLVERGGYNASQILTMTDDAAPDRRPLKKNIEAHIAQWLARPRRGDSLFVYFSGHGFRDGEGKMYLAPLDCDPAGAAATGVSIVWLRDQIKACKADVKVLALDSCHSGSEKILDARQVTAKAMSVVFEGQKGVVTLASSTDSQASLMWEDKNQSLFSYWLAQGVKGHADLNADGAVGVDELHDYVVRRVADTVEARFPRQKQTPVRIPREATPDVIVVPQLRPVSLKMLLDDMAAQLAVMLEDRKYSRLAVLEFAGEDFRAEDVLGADWGLLGRWCAEELQRSLAARPASGCTPVSSHTLAGALQKENFTLDDLARPARLNALSTALSGVPVVAAGKLRSRLGRVISVQCNLLDTTASVVGAAGGVAELTDEDLQMLGFSVQGDLEEGATLGFAPHPLQDPKFPYAVKLMVRDKQSRKFVQNEGRFVANNYYIGLAKGDEFYIQLENHSRAPVQVRLLVDGRNTLPSVVEPDTAAKGPARTHLGEARSWLLQPRKEPYAVQGFVTSLGTEGGWKLFTVAGVDPSLEGRKAFTDQLGLITASFYEAVPLKSGEKLQVVGGRDKAQQIPVTRDYKCGKFLGVVHIRYVDQQALAALGQ